MTTWLPLESNPDVLNKYLLKLGVSPLWSITDVFGLEAEQLSWVSQPVKAVILLFPCSEAYEQHRAQQDELLKKKDNSYPDTMFYTKQFIHNACGTIALVHGILNNIDIELEPTGVIKKYYDKCRYMTPEERGKILEEDMSFTDAHQIVAMEGQTEAPSIDDKVNHHFITFIHYDGILYEMDGRKSFPIKHGKTTPETLLEDAAKVCKEFMARDPNEVRFTVLAVCPTQ
uniref:Ubiquitin carboxyl-terminal hydrolase n=1 Tax=Corethrella appendiculata TaxID=1370023 RepID=U5EVC7_9DIPT